MKNSKWIHLIIPKNNVTLFYEDEEKKTIIMSDTNN